MAGETAVKKKAIPRKVNIKPARISTVYATYRFMDKDPVIAEIRAAIDASKWSWEEIANVSGVSHKTLSRWFNGSTKRPQFATLKATARTIGYDFLLQPVKGKNR